MSHNGDVAPGVLPTQRVIVMRHGERRDNAPDAPAEADPPLTEAGKNDIAVAARRLKTYLGDEAAAGLVMVVSPFLRTLQTADLLQQCGIGSSHNITIDNTLCEVFGPSRIKATSAPKLPSHVMADAYGGLPNWGESIEMATERYVSNFLRNGDLYGGYLTESSDDYLLDSSGSIRTAIPASRINRPVVPSSSQQYKAASTAPVVAEEGCGGILMSDPNRPSIRPSQDVLLVTHGDAISAVVSHFYPARVIYEAAFLSFVVMQRTGVGNHVYHLEESSGVHWIVEGIDSEPADATLQKLLCQAASPSPGGAMPFPTGEWAVPDPTVEEEEAEEEEVGEDDRCNPNTVPMSYASRRRVSGPQHRGAKGPNILAKAAVKDADKQTPLPNSGPGVHRPDGSTHPKGGEGCERIRLPSETPAQPSESVLFHGHGRVVTSQSATSRISESIATREALKCLQNTVAVSTKISASTPAAGGGECSCSLNKPQCKEKQRLSVQAMTSRYGSATILDTPTPDSSTSHYFESVLTQARRQRALRLSCLARVSSVLLQLPIFAVWECKSCAAAFFSSVVLIEAIFAVVLFASVSYGSERCNIWRLKLEQLRKLRLRYPSLPSSTSQRVIISNTEFGPVTDGLYRRVAEMPPPSSQPSAMDDTPDFYRTPQNTRSHLIALVGRHILVALLRIGVVLAVSALFQSIDAASVETRQTMTFFPQLLLFPGSIAFLCMYFLSVLLRGMYDELVLDSIVPL